MTSGDGSEDDCIAIAPGAASCIRRRADIHAVRGECDTLEADARATIAVEPNGPGAYTYLASALAAEGASVEAQRQLHHKAVELVPDKDQAGVFGLDLAARLAVFEGDFATAEARLLEQDKETATRADESAHPRRAC
jgi:hypothetical protein